MKTSIKQELFRHILDELNDGVLNGIDSSEVHFHCFNEDYYLIGYYQCSEWLKEHGLGEFEAAAICNQYEIDNFGKTSNKYDNSESTVNMLAYIYGEEVISQIRTITDNWNETLTDDLIEELREELNELID